VLPRYVGNLRDSLTKTIAGYAGPKDSYSSSGDNISDYCFNLFDKIYEKLERNLGAANSIMTKAANQFFEDIIDCVLNWAHQFTLEGYRDAFVGIFDALVELFAGDEYKDEYLMAIAVTGPGDDPNSFQSKRFYLLRDIAGYEAMMDDAQKRAATVADEILKNEKELQRLKDLLKSPNLGGLARVRIEIKHIPRLVYTLHNLYNEKKQLDSVYQATFEAHMRARKTLVELTKEWMKNNFRPGNGDIPPGGRRGKVDIGWISDLLKKFKNGFASFIAKVAQLAKTIGSLLGKLAAILGVVLGVGAMYECLDAACEKFKNSIKDIEDLDIPRILQDFTDEMKEALDSGCCDKECPPCDGGSSGSSGNNNGSSGSGSGSGVGSSCTKGVGLNLLMGNKYIPTYYDQIDENYRNKSVNPEPGKCGWKPNCPPMASNGTWFDCTKLNGANGFEDPPGNYTKSSWQNCDKPDLDYPWDPDGNIKIPNPLCACGMQEKSWGSETLEELKNICSALNAVKGFVQSTVDYYFGPDTNPTTGPGGGVAQ
jgi:hypothetical protein